MNKLAAKIATTKKLNGRQLFVRWYLIVTAAITFAIGLVLLFWPEGILQWFIPGATGGFFIKFIGSSLIGYSALNALAAHSADIFAQRLALWSNFVTLVIATGLAIYGVLSHQIHQNGWLIIFEHILFTAGFASCLWVSYKQAS